MFRTIETIQDVVDWGLCTGCGACYSACSQEGVTLVNIDSVGIRPLFSPRCSNCTGCLSICPGCAVTDSTPKRSEAEHAFGEALEIWEGYATDGEVRQSASSGGILSALSLYCLEKEGMAFVLHSAADEEKPWTNRTVQSRTRMEILARTGSRYAPASPCDGLKAIADSDQPCVFIGKPCDTAAVTSMRCQRPELDSKLGLVMTFFCAGTPSSSGTLELLKSLDVCPEDLTSLRYRGEGWPGRFTALSKRSPEVRSYSYSESWGQLTRYRPFRCHLCPDGLGRLADIACGDAWDKFNDGVDPGRSIVIVRTRRGQEILRRARLANYVTLEPIQASTVLAAQSNLLGRRQEIFGRLLAMRMLLIPTPRFAGFSLFRSWIRLPLERQMRTVVGTLRRLLLRRQWQRRRH